MDSTTKSNEKNQVATLTEEDPVSKILKWDFENVSLFFNESRSIQEI
jgi:hypothetical protein